MKCNECKNKKQVTSEEFNLLPFELARQLDCKNILQNGSQCSCYSVDNAIDKEEIIKLLSETKEEANK